jgi:hypothetical protein
MAKCDASARGVCAKPATWKQDVFAGAGDRGSFVYHAYWCDEHAARITEKRRVEWGVPPKMVQIAAPEDEGPSGG